jgi:hypothetical protein
MYLLCKCLLSSHDLAAFFVVYFSSIHDRSFRHNVLQGQGYIQQPSNTSSIVLHRKAHHFIDESAKCTLIVYCQRSFPKESHLICCTFICWNGYESLESTWHLSQRYVLMLYCHTTDTN